VAEGKIEIKVGAVSFNGEGSENWLATQLDKVIKHLPDLVKVAPALDDPTNGGAGDGAGASKGTPGKAKGTSLAGFLQAKNAKSNQVRKFLATAIWLHDNEKKTRLTTTDVSGALNSHNQGRLGNPSDILNQNVAKGHCVKDGKKQFYVPDEGREEIG
jgi:hypothetical protein